MARLSAEQIALHLGEGCLEEKLSKEARCSRAHLRRRLAELTGETPAKVKRRARKERAAHELPASEASVSEIATECGYASGQALAKDFRQAFSCSPTEFRELNRSRELPFPSVVVALGYGPVPPRTEVGCVVAPGCIATYCFQSMAPSGRIDPPGLDGMAAAPGLRPPFYDEHPQC